MEYEIKPEDYEILPAKKQSFLKKILDKIDNFAETYGGYKLIIGFCIFFFLIGFIILPEQSPYFLNLWGANSYAHIKALDAYYRWITAIFLHFGILHLGINLVWCYFFGMYLEKIWNKKTLFVVFMLSGIIASIFSFLVNKGNSAGASGGVFGLLGAFVAFLVGNKTIDPKTRDYMLKPLIILFFLNILIGVASPGIDLVGHISGFVAGFLTGKLIIWFKLNSKNKLLLILFSLSILGIFYSFLRATIAYYSMTGI